MTLCPPASFVNILKRQRAALCRTVVAYSVTSVVK